MRQSPSAFKGQTVRALRVRDGISQAEFARRIGVSRQHLINIEKGRSNPSHLLAVAIANELAVELDVISDRSAAPEVSARAG